MEYGHFDTSRREYVITKPNTPSPWANYLGSPDYGAIITNNAGGYSFAGSGSAGRVLRYRFNEQDKPGRYLYLRDDEDGDFWSASWQPVGKPPETYTSLCRHGLGYTVLEAGYRSVLSRVTYYVPMGGRHEVWSLSITNTDTKPRALSVFGYAEFTNEGHYDQDQINLQYTQFITRTHFYAPFILQTINENNAVLGEAPPSRFFAMVGEDITSYCGDRHSFLGRYRGYENPVAVERGLCDGELNYGGNGCGALHARLRLAPGETRTLLFLLGQLERDDARCLAGGYNAQRVQSELAGLSDHWRGKLQNLSVKTPDRAFNTMVNTWNPYQCFITFHWSRAASLIYCGLRNGYGYRDSVQDIQGIIHLDPPMAKEKLQFMLSAQVHHGGALPLVKFTHHPGEENSPEDPAYALETGHPSYRADDALWLFPTLYKYLAETGDMAFLDEKIPYADRGGDSVYRHLLKALDFSMNHLGLHGLPAGLHADWNDCLRLGEKGVSSFLAFQLYLAISIMARLAARRGDGEVAKAMERNGAQLAERIEAHYWDGDRYIRGIDENGEPVGSAASPEASLWLNPQTWSIISGCAGDARAEKLLDLVNRELATPYGAVLMAPAYKEHLREGALARLFNPGMKENGGVFLQTQGWLILAEAYMDRGDQAFNYYTASCPAAQDHDLREMEPYAYSQFSEGMESPHTGRSHVPWLTGTASTVMVSCVEGILGLRPDLDGLKISPAIPSRWKGMTMEKVYRGKRLNIEVARTGKGPALSLNGQKMEGLYIPANRLEEENEVLVEI